MLLVLNGTVTEKQDLDGFTWTFGTNDDMTIRRWAAALNRPDGVWIPNLNTVPTVFVQKALTGAEPTMTIGETWTRTNSR